MIEQTEGFSVEFSMGVVLVEACTTDTKSNLQRRKPLEKCWSGALFLNLLQTAYKVSQILHTLSPDLSGLMDS